MAVTFRKNEKMVKKSEGMMKYTYEELDCIAKVRMLRWMKEKGYEKMMEDYVRRYMTLDNIDRYRELSEKKAFERDTWEAGDFILSIAQDVVDVNSVEY